MNNMYLMCKDEKVMEINTDEAKYDVITPELLPYQLKGRLREVPNKLPESKYEMTQFLIAGQKNYEAVINYAASRVLPLTRKNAKKIYQLFGYEQLQDDYSKAQIAFICKAVSLQDNYWFKTDNDFSKWSDVNLRTNHLNEIVAQVSLYGSSLSLTGSLCTPELNGQGAYAKAWKRENNELYLHKLGSDELDYESKLEVSVSNILDKCSVSHVRYTGSQADNRFTCKCKCMTTEDISILPGMDFISYCNRNNLNPDREIMKIDSDSIYKMWIVDYLISNSDRHGMNWGFYYDANTMDIISCHPLFDHNNAFDKDIMKNPNIDYLYNKNITMKEAAHIAIEHTDFYFIDDFSKEDFLSEEQFESFASRADELQIKTIIETKNAEDSIER